MVGRVLRRGRKGMDNSNMKKKKVLLWWKGYEIHGGSRGKEDVGKSAEARSD